MFKKDSNGTLEPIKELTKLKLPLRTNMYFKIRKNSNGKLFVIDKLEPFKLKQEVDKTAKPMNHLLGKDKFPMFEGKLGALQQNIDNLLGNSTQDKISSSRIKQDVSLFVRHGIAQIPNMSFIQGRKILNTDYKSFIKSILKHLTPEEFITLNNGELLKLFSESLK